MSRIAYVNGRYLPQREASVNVEDRGYQFADGVYEVVLLHRGRFVDEDAAPRPAGPLAARDADRAADAARRAGCVLPRWRGATG